MAVVQLLSLFDLRPALPINSHQTQLLQRAAPINSAKTFMEKDMGLINIKKSY